MQFSEVGELASQVHVAQEKVELELVVLVEGLKEAVEKNMELKQRENPDHTMV